MLLSETFHIRAMSRMIAPKIEQFADFGNRKPETARPPDKPEPVNIFFRIQPISGRSPIGGRNQPDLFIITDHFGRYARFFRRLTDTDHVFSLISPPRPQSKSAAENRPNAGRFRERRDLKAPSRSEERRVGKQGR